jgi:hypothetical protein
VNKKRPPFAGRLAADRGRVLGMWWSLAFDLVAKPAIVIAIGGWLAWLMVKPERWCGLIEVLNPAR